MLLLLPSGRAITQLIYVAFVSKAHYLASATDENDFGKCVCASVCVCVCVFSDDLKKFKPQKEPNFTISCLLPVAERSSILLWRR